MRSLVFQVCNLPAPLCWLLCEFRLLVNKSIRVAADREIRSRYRLQKAMYRQLSAEHAVYKQYIPSAFEVAIGALKAYRRRVRKGCRASTPFLRRPLLKAENQSYRLDRTTGQLRIPIRAGEHVELSLPLSEWHRSFLDDSSWRLGSLTVVPGRIIVALRKQASLAYEPEAAIALDTNEDSLDGLVATRGRASFLSISYGGVREVQTTHFRRRRRLAHKKAHDLRVGRRLLTGEGRRERNRVRQRLHSVSKRLVMVAKAYRAAIVLEALTLPGPRTLSRSLNRRLSSWPHREIHRQIEYKAILERVPVIKISPSYTSKTCPACGELKGRRERVGKVFECPCGWRLDRQLNAGLNILQTALASDEVLARAVRFQPGALRKDVVIPLRPPRERRRTGGAERG